MEKKKKRRDDDDLKDLTSTTGGAVLPTTNGHINLFEDLEQVGLFFNNLNEDRSSIIIIIFDD